MKDRPRRRRWQVELRTGDEQAIDLAREVFGAENESQVGRELLGFWKRVVDAIRAGQIFALHRADDPLALDAFPELARALRPDYSYDFLVRVPHPWRRQLLIKGRRQTATQLVTDMRSNDWDVDRAAREFDLDRRAVVEALDYVDRNQSLIVAEIAEERRRIDPYFHRAPSPR